MQLCRPPVSLTVPIQINVTPSLSTAISSLLFRGVALTSAVDELESRGGQRKGSGEDMPGQGFAFDARILAANILAANSRRH